MGKYLRVELECACLCTWEHSIYAPCIIVTVFNTSLKHVIQLLGTTERKSHRTGVIWAQHPVSIHPSSEQLQISREKYKHWEKI